MNAMAGVVLVLGILAIGGVISLAIWGVGKVLDAILWLVGIVLRGIGWLVGTLIGWSIRGIRGIVQIIALRRSAAARRSRE